MVSVFMSGLTLRNLYFVHTVYVFFFLIITKIIVGSQKAFTV